jgi:adenine phosphoribosyltransferase
MDEIRKAIREIPDFPKDGILFYDITTLFMDPAAMKRTIDLMAAPWIGKKVNKVMGIEARGFVIAALLAYKLDAGLIVARKPGKLPHKTISAKYSLEYGKDSLEVHRDSVEKGDKVLIVDDLLATGGTAKAAAKLVEKLKGKVAGISFVIELTFLNGRKKISKYDIQSLIQYHK